MIVSASRRTDIPAQHSEWFYNRLKEGFVLVRNPYNPNQVGRVTLSPEAVDGFVFWTKNAAPMLPRLDELDGYQYYFQFTITPYGADVERQLPDKKAVIIPAFQQLAKTIGAERVIWRYDPIFVNDRYSIEYHLRAFGQIAEALKGYTRQVTISFVDFYRNVDMRLLQIKQLSDSERYALINGLAHTAQSNSMKICSCSENLGLEAACCVDGAMFGVKKHKDRNQRELCRCVESVDIGSYSTCANGCAYCYANQYGRVNSPPSIDCPVLGPPLTGMESIKQRN